MKFYEPSDLIKPGPCERVDGTGLFAVKPIAANTHLGMIRIETNRQIYRTDLGPYGNHPDSGCEPNAVSIDSFMFKDVETVKYFFGEEAAGLEFVVSKTLLATLSDIEPGDEVVWNYRLPEYSGAVWL